METKRVARRKHSAQFRAEVLQACRHADASVAAIALRNGLKANVVYRWLREDARGVDAGAGSHTAVNTRPGAEFIAVQLPPAAVAAASADIRIEARRGSSTVTVAWPLQASAECAAWLLAHTLVGRFVDHLPCYRQEQINARSGVHTPRSTLAAWSGRAGAGLMPLYEVHRAFVLGAAAVYADETPVNMLDPGSGKTKRAYVWAYARSASDALPGVAYDFCIGRAAKYPIAFLKGWSGTLVCDGYKAYESVFKLETRIEAGCMAHARRKFDELIKENQSPVAAQAVQRIAWLYRIEKEARELPAQERLAMRQARAGPLCEELHLWLRLERQRVPDGSAIAGAIDYSLNCWTALTAYLVDGNVAIDNNHIENLMRPWAMGRKAWLFAGSELAGQRAAVVMSLVQSARMHGHDPWAYLKDVLTRLPGHINSRIDELLPHRWQPAG